MKNTRKTFVKSILMLLIVAMVLSVAACNNSRTVTLSFETNGGGSVEAITLQISCFVI